MTGLEIGWHVDIARPQLTNRLLSTSIVAPFH